METNNFKKSGKIIDFDGEAGTIKALDTEYLFTIKDIINEKKEMINILKSLGDFPVEFNSNTIKFGNEKILVAKNIDILKYKDADLKIKTKE